MLNNCGAFKYIAFLVITSCAYFFPEDDSYHAPNTLPQLIFEKLSLSNTISARTNARILPIGTEYIMFFSGRDIYQKTLFDGGIFNLQTRNLEKKLSALVDADSKCMYSSSIIDTVLVFYQNNNKKKYLQKVDLINKDWVNIELPEAIENTDLCNLLLVTSDTKTFWIIENKNPNLIVYAYNNSTLMFDNPIIATNTLQNELNFQTTIQSSNSVFLPLKVDKKQKGSIAQLQIRPQIKYIESFIPNIFYANILTTVYQEKFLFIAQTTPNQIWQFSLNSSTQIENTKNPNIKRECLSRETSNISYNGRHLLFLTSDLTCKSQIFDEQNQTWFDVTENNAPIYKQPFELKSVPSGFVSFAVNTNPHLYHLNSQLWIKSTESEVIPLESAPVIIGNTVLSFGGIMGNDLTSDLLMWSIQDD